MAPTTIAAIGAAAERMADLATVLGEYAPAAVPVMLGAMDGILRILDEAEKDTIATVTRNVCYDHGEITNYGAYRCDKCGAKQPDRYPYCHGCGRYLARNAEQEEGGE